MVIRKPVCFIAMAFGREDTEALYCKQIEPVLKRNDVTPIILNRLEHNDDINNIIINQLNECDFCIADLTYARPSVYFEAGYAQRSVEVIYTVRKDHLERNTTEDLRVHFDLQMKPLIPWSSPNDDVFGNRLERRLKSTFLSKWHRDKSNEKLIEDQETEFSSLSLTDRLISIRKFVISHCRKLKFSKWILAKSYTNSISGISYNLHKIRTGEVDRACSWREINGKIVFVSVQALESLTKRDFLDLKETYHPLEMDLKYNFSYSTRPISNFSINIIILLLRSFPASSIERIISSFSPEVKGKIYNRHSENIPFRLGLEPGNLSETWYFLSGIRSIVQLNLQYNELIKGRLLEQIREN